MATPDSDAPSQREPVALDELAAAGTVNAFNRYVTCRVDMAGA